MTNSNEPKPDFLIIGAAKSGTSTLFRYLARHPRIYASPHKEPNFFGADDNYTQGFESYAKLFADKRPGQISGEASTDYAKWPKFPESAARIAHHLPQAKLIYIMRNPIDRAYSYYVHLNRNKPFLESFEDYIARTTEALDASNYMLQIEQYLKFFPKESFLFLLLEDMEKQPAAVVKQVCRFLSIDDSVNCTDASIVENQGKKVFEDHIRGKVTSSLKRIPLVSAAARLVPQHWRDVAYDVLRRTRYGEGVVNQYTPRKMLPETREMLRKKFQGPNSKLSEFIGRDLSHWT